MSFGIYGQRVAYKTPNPNKKDVPIPSVMDAYKQQNPYNSSAYTQNAVVPQGITNQMNYMRGIPTGYTPEQELAMRNRVRSTDTAQNAGAMSKIRDYMASMGLGGSGQETAALGAMMRGQNATRQGALSNIDLSNTQLANQNAYQKAGMLNQLTGMGEQARQFGMGLGENARQFDTGQYNNMYQYGTGFDESKRRYDQERLDYQKQLEDWMRELNNRNGGGSGTTVGWGR
jgi:hypothetical protein